MKVVQQVFVGQTLLTIQLDTEYVLTAATKLSVLYRTPTGKVGEWVASIGSDNTYIEYEVQDGDLTEPGEWQVQAYAEFATKKIYGEIATMSVYDPVFV